MSEPIFIARQDTLEQEILPAHWLAQYKLFGEESYTFQDKGIWKKLCMSRAAANDRDMHAEALEEMLTTFSAEHTGKWMLLVYGMDAAALEGLATMAAIAANGTAMGAIADNALLMHAIANSETAMQRIANSQTAMQRVANNRGAMDAIGRSRIARDAVQASPYYNSYIKENDMAIAKLVVGFANLESAGYSGCAGMAADSTAMTAVAASSTAMTAVAASSTAMTAVAASGVALKAIAQAYKNTANMLQFLKAVNASDTLIKRIYNTLTNATALFGTAQLGGQDSVADANKWATTSAAPNAFLACACGYYNSGGASVDVTYNGTAIAQNKTGTRQPGSVTSTNVNAITMAPSTFTENGDGWLAVQKFTVK
ncbi:hypothetical protein DW773_09585 [Firmicutes bacterium AM29-6AC]|uniref:Uncharacterized protein n=1 Tax=Anaerotignum faecicola TaxID=2358141 RepID=A0A401LGC6_9FIRM|nr:hypothetical protein [Anaerotignum faecicola]RHR15123.1 hypothetical protein DWX47_05510 [Firmicutes bacterium AF19-2LB]RHT39069.1 hypothetical protein DW773_09585 [Firmicutes bacterium AM29-6AC]GCB30557.1 hypothetical protein KGMB03357_22180 [Anaerotignum faecicola]